MYPAYCLLQHKIRVSIHYFPYIIVNNVPLLFFPLIVVPLTDTNQEDMEEREK